jgi:hypothetical protein
MRALKHQNVTGKDLEYDKLKKLKSRFCDSCYKGHMRAFTSNPIGSKVWKIFEKIGIDYKGKFPHRTYKGEKGFYLFADQESNYLKAYLCKSQKEILSFLIDYMETVVKRTNST